MPSRQRKKARDPPAFRLPEPVVRQDVERIESLGVKIERSHPVAAPPEALLDEGFDAVYVATGFPKRARLGIEGVHTEDQKQDLIDSFAAEKAAMLEWGSMPPDMAELTDWQFILRAFLVQDQADYAAVIAAAMQSLNSGVDEQASKESVVITTRMAVTSFSFIYCSPLSLSFRFPT